LFDTVPPFSSVEQASMAAKVFGTIFVIADQQTLDCSIVRACPRDWWIVTASIYNAKFRP
jgi:hypothetical protein